MDEERERRWSARMAEAQAGDAASYEKLLAELLPVLRRFVRRRIPDAEQAKDVVQNAFVSLHRARHTYRPERPLGPWLYAIARNAIVDHARARERRGRREIPLGAESGPEPAAEPAAPEPELSSALEAALRALPPGQREAVLLLQVEGLSVAEAALQAGVTRTALKVRAHRGYRALRRILGAGREVFES